MQRSSWTRLDRNTLTPFFGIAGVWLLLAFALTAYFSKEPSFGEFGWVCLLWALSLLDLYVLSRALGAAFELASEPGEKRGALIIQASYWGVIKLLCLGTFGAILSMNGRSIPVISLLMGPGTLVTVPLLGGYWWSQRVLRHA
jgi:uncharacterized membrane protein